MYMDKTKLRDDASTWGRSPFVFQLGKDFSTYREVVEYITNIDAKDLTIENVSSMADFKEFVHQGIPGFYMGPNQSDSSLGGNDAINCYWQFCENDDVIHPLTSKNTQLTEGMGRVYSEVYDKHQQVLYMSFGVPKFGHMGTFYNNLIHPGLTDVVNNGSTSIAKTLGRLFGGVIAVRLAFSIPFLPLAYLVKWVADKVDTERVTKYYDFKATMPMYFRYVNGILAHLAVNMGLSPDGFTGTTQFGTYHEMYQNQYRGDGEQSIPTILKHGPNIFKIISKRDKNLSADGLPGTQTQVDDEDYFDGTKSDEDEDGLFSGFFPRLMNSAVGADKFIGFRIDKSVDSSESLSNNSGESSVAQFLSGQAQSGRDRMFSISGGNLVDLGGVINGVADGLVGLVSGAIDSIGVTGAAKAIMTGAGYPDIPEVYQGSSFSKSYSFAFSLRAPAGDPVSIMQAIYVPLACLLAAALPRTVGRNAYTSPFLIRAYCKGMFAIPLGIIDSMTIRRGASEFGWSIGQLPTVIDVSFTIKDLSPIMHVPMPSAIDSLVEIFGQNSSFQEYLLTLSGMGLNERLIWPNKIRRKMETAFRMFRTTYGSSLYWATSIGNSSIPRLLGEISPWSRYPRN